jgi:hypothetical protein
MHSRIGSRLTMRSVCHTESTPPASHRSTQRQKPATLSNGNSISPSPTATFLGIEKLLADVAASAVSRPAPAPPTMLPFGGRGRLRQRPAKRPARRI